MNGGLCEAMRIALVYNPRMLPVRLAKVAALAHVLESRGHGVSHHDSQGFVAADEAVPPDLVCICGGDGTAQLVIANQSDPAALPPIAVYPTGTINLLARELDYSANPQEFALRIESGRSPLYSRLATINGRTFLCCVSVGADAYAVAALSEPLKARIGRLAYLVALGKVMLDWPRQAMQVTCDGAAFTVEALFILRGNLYAGPWTLDRKASLSNPALRVLALPRARRRDLARLVFNALLGRERAAPDWLVLDARHMTISSDRPVPIQIDGDPGGSTPLEIAMTTAEVRFF